MNAHLCVVLSHPVGLIQAEKLNTISQNRPIQRILI